MATPPTRVFPRYSDLNDWQDQGVRAMLLDQTATFTGWGGAFYGYWQGGPIAQAAHQLIEFKNPHVIGVPPAISWANRILLMHYWTENNADELPSETNYDPNTFQNVPVQRLWHTGNGATQAVPPVVGTFLNHAAIGIYFYALDTDTTEFYCTNNSGVAINLSMSAWIWESD